MSNARFSITPSSAVEDKDLSDSVYRTLSCIGVFGDKNGWCWPGLATIAKMRGVSKSRISQDVKILVNLGYLQVQRRFDNNTQQSNLYRILFDTPLTPEVNPPLTPEVNPPLTPEVNQNAPINESINAQLSDDDEKRSAKVGHIITLHENLTGAVQQMIVSDLEDAAEKYPAEWIDAAYKIAAENNVRKWTYVKACLRNIQENGLDYKPGKTSDSGRQRVAIEEY